MDQDIDLFERLMLGQIPINGREDVEFYNVLYNIADELDLSDDDPLLTHDQCRQLAEYIRVLLEPIS